VCLVEHKYNTVNTYFTIMAPVECNSVIVCGKIRQPAETDAKMREVF
jgi:hypothetical protein